MIPKLLKQRKEMNYMKKKIRIVIYSRKSKYTGVGDSCRKSN